MTPLQMPLANGKTAICTPVNRPEHTLLSQHPGSKFALLDIPELGLRWFHIYVRELDEAEKAAQELARLFKGEVIDDPDGSLGRLYGNA